MATVLEPLREHLARTLDWEEAHAGFSKAIDGIAAERRGERPAGFEHSLWQLLEHLRLALKDLVDFAVNPRYVHTMKWPDDYWPKQTTPSDTEWSQSVAAFRADLARLQALARDPAIDLYAPVPTGKPAQTHLRNILLAIDHNAYHVGQIVALRRALGIWP
jgi:hypothetical protein